MATKTRASIYETYEKIARRMERIDTGYKNRSDHLVLADLREGKPVIVARGFKGLGKEWVKGEEFTCEMMDIQRLSFIMENSGRILVTKQEHTDREEWTRLKPIHEALAPMVEKARNLATERERAHGQLAAAEAAVKHWRSEMEAAETNHARAEQEAAEYISGLELDI